MSNKKLHLILWLVLSMFIGVVWSFTSAISFKLDFNDGYGRPETWWEIRQNMVPIHFNDNLNDFYWFIYFSDGIVESTWSVATGYIVELGTSRFECQKKVKWFYYNAERWERLWPLDGRYGDIVASGWLYTRCRQFGYSEALAKCAKNYNSEQDIKNCEDTVEEKYVDTKWYHGMVTHDSDGQTFALVAWTNYDTSSNWLKVWNDLASTFVRIDNKYPVWFIYDGNGWAWFVWCTITWSDAKSVFLQIKSNWGDLHSLFKRGEKTIQSEFLSVDCNNEWSAMNSLIKVVVDGLVGINKDNRTTGIQWNQSNAKMQYFSSVSVNNMQLISYARQKAEILCRGKWKNDYSPSSDKIVCVSSSSSSPIQAKTNETLIVKWWVDVEIKDMDDFDSVDYYDIFVDGGNLLIGLNTWVTNDNLTVFKRNWFKSNTDLFSFKDQVTTVRESGHDYSGDDVAAWRFIRWNFIVNWSIKPDSSLTGLQNVYFVYWKMTSKDTVDQLEETFVWKCSVWSGSDWVPCPWWWKASDGTTWTNPYQNASLVIIDQNYPSPLYQ